EGLKAGAGNPKMAMMPEGAIQTRTDYGVAGYGGPCPPEGHGAHQYVITVYALPMAKLGLDENATPAVVGYYLNQNAIGRASVVFYHSR
ncbi:MAG: YbhB/YbcL family Raf kinase inhibitor-like protein, partial [Bacteroidota bacterium]